MTFQSAMQTSHIRRMTPDDLSAVAEIDSVSFSLPWPKSSYEYELRNKVSRLWVIEVEGPQSSRVIAGMICAWVIENEGHIATFAILPDYRRMGLGGRLLAFALLDAAAEGVELVYLEVRRSNQAAIALYGEFGFNTTGIRTGYYSDNHEDAFMMTLEHPDPRRLQELLDKYQ